MKDEATTPRNNKMGFIQLVETALERDYKVEYEFASEARIAGQLQYSDADIILRLIGMEPDRDGLYRYVLSVSAPASYKLMEASPPAPTADGYYFEGGVDEEMLGLLSLFFRRRFFTLSGTFRGLEGPPMTRDDRDFAYRRPTVRSDMEVFLPETGKNLVDVEAFFEQVRQLPEEFHHGLAHAARLYALALREVGSNDQLAYIHLVSAIEILSSKVELEERDDPLAKHAAEIQAFVEKQKWSLQVKSEFSNNLAQRKATRKFIRFIESCVGSYVAEKPAADAIENKIYREDLENALTRIYRARSKYLHEGAYMYLSMPGMTVAGADYDASGGLSIENRAFDAADKLPNIAFFEGLVRHCRISYLEDKFVA